MTNVLIGEGLSGIRSNAFQSCLSLAGATVGKHISNLESNAFNGCTGLNRVLFKGNAPGPGTNLTVFSGDSHATIYFLPGTTG